MHCYSLYYYKTAQQLRPYDSRMLVALGETYEKLDKTSNALKCFQKAYNVGDIEGMAIQKLATLYENLGDRENAVLAYRNFVREAKPEEKTSLCHAHQYLGEYYLSKGNFEEATHYAYKILELEEGKAEGKNLLKSIEAARNARIEKVSNIELIEMAIHDDDDSMPGMISIETSDIDLE